MSMPFWKDVSIAADLSLRFVLEDSATAAPTSAGPRACSHGAERYD